jgi:hypothetical protein
MIEWDMAPCMMGMGVLGVAETHDNPWARYLVLKLLQCEGAKYLLIEFPPTNVAHPTGPVNLPSTVNQITGDGNPRTFDSGAAKLFDWGDYGMEYGRTRLSVIIHAAQVQDVKVVCADHPCSGEGSEFATTSVGMGVRNEHIVNTLLSLAPTPAELKGVIMLNGLEHFTGTGTERTIPELLQEQLGEGLIFDWVDATTQAGSGFGTQGGADPNVQRDNKTIPLRGRRRR